MNSQVSSFEKFLLKQVEDRKVSLYDAADDLALLHDQSLIQLAVKNIEARLEENFPSGDAVLDVGYVNAPKWYYGPKEGGHWARYRDLLQQKGHPGVSVLDRESTRITALLADPTGGAKRKGLVMGNVQSGKTANFAGVIAKAADAGYRMVIVLSGLHNNLRKQTQIRLDHDVFADGEWVNLTDPDYDFEARRNGSVLFAYKVPVACVIKKNKSRLQRLVNWLRSVPEEVRRASPILIIDDEADQATPNSEAQRNRVSAINQILQDLWGEVIVGTYVAYTATPFANVFMDPDDDADLFPSDFITTLSTGVGYFGAERVFGLNTILDPDGLPESEGLDMVRTIPSDEAALLRPPTDAESRLEHVPPVPPTLQDAIRWFLLATAVRWARGQREHSSMLVHTTHYADPHRAMAEQIEVELTRLRQELEIGSDAGLQELWESEKARVRSEDHEPPTYAELKPILPAVLEACAVIVDNGSSDVRLDYSTDEAQTVIAVGGGTLARGLTLEGLVSSYFVRTTNTYDTLMQMGRWFGYRGGYEDLPRIWVADGLDADYAFLAQVESDLRVEIQSFSGSEYTPKQVGVRVRSHPGRLEITSRNRMFHARSVQVSLSGEIRQTFILTGRDEDVAVNFSCAERLFAGHPLEPIEWNRNRGIARGLSANRVSEFLTDFRQHPDQGILGPRGVELMKKWLSDSAPEALWNVVVMGNSNKRAPGTGDFLGESLIGGNFYKNVNRAPLKDSDRLRLNFKAILSGMDILADIPPALFQGHAVREQAQRKGLRRRFAQSRGLVLLYPISAFSAPRNQGAKASRMVMPEGTPTLLGFGIVFPEVRGASVVEGDFFAVRDFWGDDTYDDALDAEADSDEVVAR